LIENNEVDYEAGIFNLNENVFYISSYFLIGALIPESMIELSFSTFHLLE
jgi:hypothetical protein